MNPFLHRLADTLIQQYPRGFGSIAIVFPSNRACLWFKKVLAEKLPPNSWLPEIITIEHFVSRISGYHIPDRQSLVFEMFPVFQEVYPETPLDRFLSTAETMLNDFEDADDALADPNALFSNVFDLREIDVSIQSWNNEDKQPTEFQLQYLDFWKNIRTVYEKLSERLLQDNQAWYSLALRKIVERKNIDQNGFPWPKVILAGFFGLSNAEMVLFKALVQEGMGDCYWDVDAHLCRPPMTETANFFRKIDAEIPGDFHWVEQHFGSFPQQIETISVPGKVGQAKALGRKISEMMDSGISPSEIAIVLPDEHLLFPVLHSLPENIGPVNVTMGFPMLSTPAWGLMNAFILLHENAEKFSSKKRGPLMNHRDVIRILQHPYIQKAFPEFSKEVISDIHQNNRVFLTKNDFKDLEAGSLIQSIFVPGDRLNNPVEYFEGIFSQLIRLYSDPEESQDSQPDIEKEFLFGMMLMINRLKERISRFDIHPDLQAFRKLFRTVARGTRIPFSGEPILGIQIMGILETRLLDFKHLIILSVNEESLPPGKNFNTFIPYSLRKAFEITTQEDRDSKYSYYFFRLLQRATSTSLFFNSDSDAVGKGEPSRFILQIREELARTFDTIHYSERAFSFPALSAPIPGITVRRSPDIQQSLLDYIQDKGMSSTALQTWIRCRLKFYFRYVLRLKEEDTASEEPGADVIGTVMHDVLEELYTPFKDKVVTPEDIQGLKTQVPDKVLEVFKRHLKGSSLRYGKNRLLSDTMTRLIQKLLEKEKEDAPFRIVSLEDDYELKWKSGETEVRLSGRIDRVDEKNGQIRVVDYKTGTYRQPSFKSLDELLEVPDDYKKDKKEAFQLLLYAWLYLESEGHATEKVYPGIYFLKKLSDGWVPLKQGESQDESVSKNDLESIKEFIKQIIEDILAFDNDFTQTEKVEQICGLCDYKGICHREI